MGRLVVLAAVVSLVFTDSAFARRRLKASEIAACDKIVEVTSGGYIYKNSAPIRSGGVGTPLIGYRKEPTLIMVKRVNYVGRSKIFDSQGTRIGLCPWASAHDTLSGRFRCTMSTAGLRDKAKDNTGSPKIYFKINAKTCVEVPDAGRCYGSVKGLCNQVIK